MHRSAALSAEAQGAGGVPWAHGRTSKMRNALHRKMRVGQNRGDLDEDAKHFLPLLDQQ
jgi:hypothetical protein